ncbi:MAG: phosphate acyltransferase PlsX [Deltaproteobacteria bacterium]|nr:phosphate acyltransferase PlsX [Deltaproteobacteria bacterium]
MSLLNVPSLSSALPVAIDAMGGDFGPEVVVEGAVLAARELGINVILVGQEPQLKNILSRFRGAEDKRIQIKHAPDTISMDDTPALAIRKKPNSSVRVAFELVKSKQACGVVSPGNTGAVMAAGIFVLGTVPGIARPAIATLIPKSVGSTPTVLLDSGANIDCHAHQLVQFALMGNYYAMSAIHIERPRVALLSNGTEESKGNDITRSAAMMLSGIPGIHFVGYVEGRDLARDVVDVIVCDGFVGNIVLKAIEGSVEIVLDTMKHQVDRSGLGRLGMWLAKPTLKAVFKEQLDPSSFGGAPLLGLNDVAIVCHGAANAKAIMNAVRVAKQTSDEGLCAKIAAALSSLDLRMPGAYDENIWNKMGQRFEKKRKPRELEHESNGDQSAAEEIELDSGVQNE